MEIQRRMFGVWCGGGWLARANGEVIASPDYQVMQAYLVNEKLPRTGELPYEVREIGSDGLPVPIDANEEGTL